MKVPQQQKQGRTRSHCGGAVSFAAWGHSPSTFFHRLGGMQTLHWGRWDLSPPDHFQFVPFSALLGFSLWKDLRLLSIKEIFLQNQLSPQKQNFPSASNTTSASTPVFFPVEISILFTVSHIFILHTVSRVMCGGILVGSAGPGTCCESLNKYSDEPNHCLHIGMALTVRNACTVYHMEKSGTISHCDLDSHIVEVLLCLHVCFFFGSEKYQTETLLNTCESNWVSSVNQRSVAPPQLWPCVDIRERTHSGTYKDAVSPLVR